MIRKVEKGQPAQQFPKPSKETSTSLKTVSNKIKNLIQSKGLFKEVKGKGKRSSYSETAPKQGAQSVKTATQSVLKWKKAG